jgi:5-deoxy-D-glucuronate isomerase
LVIDEDYSWIQSHDSKPLKINPKSGEIHLGKDVIIKENGEFKVNKIDAKEIKADKSIKVTDTNRERITLNTSGEISLFDEEGTKTSFTTKKGRTISDKMDVKESLHLVKDEQNRVELNTNGRIHINDSKGKKCVEMVDDQGVTVHSTKKGCSKRKTSN